MPDTSKPVVIIADDDENVFKVLDCHLNQWGYRTVWAEDKAQLFRTLSGEHPCLLLLDVCFGKYNGVELLGELQANYPDLTIAMLTGRGSINTAVTAIKRGAHDFLTKPMDLPRLQVILEHAAHKQALNQRLRALEELADSQGPGRQIWGDSAAVERVRQTVACIAASDATVLILGESGTGKELVARAIHQQSRRRQGPFVAVNTTALPHELVESALFGHEKGAFTGADQARIGCFETADGGTLFLDEVGEMDLRIQTKFLRFLQERTLQRVGSSSTRTVDVRLLAATNRNLQQAIQQGQFREDLYYRLHVVPITVPPLRARREDISLLAARFLQRASLRHGKNVTGFSAGALSILSGHDWPGNVRQLENLVERLVIFARHSEIQAEDIPAEIAGTGAVERPPCQPSLQEVRRDGPGRLEHLEMQAIVEALRQTDGHVGEAARLLGLGRATVYRKIRQYGVGPKSPAAAAPAGAF